MAHPKPGAVKAPRNRVKTRRADVSRIILLVAISSDVTLNAVGARMIQRGYGETQADGET